MAPSKRKAIDEAATGLARVAPPVSRWIERLLASHDPPLSPAQHQALRTLAEGDVGGAELARRATVTPAAASQLVAALETMGYVQREAVEGDRRRHSLALTAAGRTALESADALLRTELASLIGDLKPHDADELSRSLALLDALLSGKTPPRRPPRPHPPHLSGEPPGGPRGAS